MQKRTVVGTREYRLRAALAAHVLVASEGQHVVVVVGLSDGPTGAVLIGTHAERPLGELRIVENICGSATRHPHGASHGIPVEAWG